MPMATGSTLPGNEHNQDPLWCPTRKLETPIKLVVTDAIKGMALQAVVFTSYEGKVGKGRSPKIYIAVLDSGNHRDAEGVNHVLGALENLNTELYRRGMPRLLVKEREGKILVVPDWRRIACGEAHFKGRKIEFPAYFGALKQTCFSLRGGREL